MRQLKAMIKKHYIMKRRMKGQWAGEFIMPLFYGGLLRFMSYLFSGGLTPDAPEEEKQKTREIAKLFIPFLLIIYIP